MTGKLMPFTHDPAHQRRVGGRDAAEREESGLHARLGEQREDGVGVALHPDFLRRPVGARYRPFERADLIPVLDIDGEGVEHCGALS